MHADELDIDEALVRRLLAAQFPRWAELPIDALASGGTDNAIYRLGDELSVRLPRRRDWRPGSPDNAPLIGATSVDRLFVASGHYRNGILLAPITADLVAAAVTGTVAPADRELLDVVSPQRFERVGTSA